MRWFGLATKYFAAVVIPVEGTPTKNVEAFTLRKFTSETADSKRGKELQHDFSRQPVVPGRTQPIPPGATATTVVEVPSPPPGRFRLSLQMVSEGVKWFGPSAPIDLTVKAPADGRGGASGVLGLR